MLVNDPTKVRRQTVILALVLGLLQIAVAPNIGIGSGRANLALVFVGCMCMGSESSTAPFYGFFAGLFYDLVGSGPIGLMALILTAAAWILSLAGQTKPSEDLGSALAFYGPVAAVVNVVYAIVLLISGQAESFIATIVFHALPAIILDIAVFALVAFIMGRTSTPSSGLGSARHSRSKGGLSMKRGL